jgi:hypothetical protein
MTNFELDVKAFITITVQAENEGKAREIADEAVEMMSPSDEDIETPDLENDPYAKYYEDEEDED